MPRSKKDQQTPKEPESSSEPTQTEDLNENSAPSDTDSSAEQPQAPSTTDQTAGGDESGPDQTEAQASQDRADAEQADVPRETHAPKAYEAFLDPEGPGVAGIRAAAREGWDAFVRTDDAKPLLEDMDLSPELYGWDELSELEKFAVLSLVSSIHETPFARTFAAQMEGNYHRIFKNLENHLRRAMGYSEVHY